MKLPDIRSGHHGIVASGHRLATDEGARVLRDGGNAFDAAIAAAATLAIVAPHECGLGGDLFAIVYAARTKTMSVLNGSGRAPRAATPDRYAEGIPETGPLSMSVPGMVGAWGALHERYGSRPLGSLFAGAIRYAEEGFAITDVLARNIAARQAAIAANAACAALFFRDGAPAVAGTILRQPGAAATLRRLSDEGCGAFYTGALAQLIARELADVGSIVSADDLVDFTPLWQAPLSAPFGDHVVHTTPPNSFGAATLVQLARLAQEGIAGDDVHFFLQGMRIRDEAYRLLAGRIADPDSVGDAAQAALADVLAGTASTSGPTHGPIAGSDTSQILCADDAGNIVSILQSVSIPFGSGIYLPQSGVLLNNRLSGFDAKPGGPNALAPRKRPANTLVPALVTRDGAPCMACATPGGPGQTGTLAQVLSRIIFRGEAMNAAIAAPRWSVSRYGDLLIEDTAPPDVREAVKAVFPAVKTVGWGAVNAGSVAMIRRHDGVWSGTTDLRRDASVRAI